MQQAIASKIMSRITDANLHCAAVQYTFVFEIGPLGPAIRPLPRSHYCTACSSRISNATYRETPHGLRNLSPIPSHSPESHSLLLHFIGSFPIFLLIRIK